MRVFASIVFLGLSFILQSTLLSQFSVGGIVPNLLIITVASIGFLIGQKYGLITGFTAGLLVDIFFGNVIGLYALLYMYVGYINGAFRKILFPGDFKLPLVLIVGSDFVYGNLCYFFLFLFKGEFHYLYYLSKIIIPEVVYTTVVACIFFPLIKFVFRRIELREEKALEESV